MIYQYIEPTTILKPYIKHYWILEEENPLNEPCKQRIFPSGFTELIFYYGDKYININKKNKSSLQPFFQFTGQNSEYYDVVPTGKIGLIAITFNPDAAKLFFNIPISELENNSEAIYNILGNKIKDLENELHDSLNNNKRIQLIENFLVHQLKGLYTIEYERIKYSISKINQYKGLISIENLSDYACLSAKQFNRTFSSFVGTNPKQFTRIVRFQNAIYNQQHKTSKNLTELAYNCGYYDQAHFTNEFKSFTGHTPSDFFKICEPFSDYFS